MTGSPWRTRALVLLGLWLATCAGVSIFGARPSYGLVALVFGAGGAVVLLFLDVSARSEPAVWRLPGEDRLRPPGEDPRFALLRRVIAGHLDSHRVDGTLHSHVMAVADRRLVAHHGVHRLADPERAAALMGPELTAFAGATQPYPRLDVREIAVLIDRIEDL